MYYFVMKQSTMLVNHLLTKVRIPNWLKRHIVIRQEAVDHCLSCGSFYLADGKQRARRDSFKGVVRSTQVDSQYRVAIRIS